MSDVQNITPKALAEEIGIDPKRLRSYLRANFARPAEAKNTTWGIAPDAAKAAREHFAAKVAKADDAS